MKSKMIVLMMVAGAFWVACNSGEAPLTDRTTEVPAEPEPTPAATLKPREDIVLTRAEEAVVAGNNAFAFNLLRQVAGETQADNLLVSPLSLSLALAMLNNGANGQTQEEIQTALGYGDVTREEANGYFRKITDAMQELDTCVRFESANSIWIAKDFPVLDAFKEVNQTYFDADVLDFDLSDPAGTVKRINDWCSEKTHGLIPQLLDAGGEAVMYLVNALYFKGSWTSPFDKSKTKEAPFHNLNGSTANLPTMQQIELLKYARTETFELVELPYGNEAFDMTLLLPATDVSAASVLETLDATAWNDVLEKRSWWEIDIRLPRFKVEYKRTLNKDLMTLGMTSMFGDADFSLISPFPLFVSKVLQKTALEVNEEGAEGAAATVIGMIGADLGVEPVPPPVVAFNRPFIYFIKEKSTGSILFAGIITNL
ncbi:MAG: serpin family protein [Tannerella sp.]|jgi:serpin B|nr:serpin family protein [Tannerella sp.]